MVERSSTQSTVGSSARQRVGLHLATHEATVLLIVVVHLLGCLRLTSLASSQIVDLHTSIQRLMLHGAWLLKYLGFHRWVQTVSILIRTLAMSFVNEVVAHVVVVILHALLLAGVRGHSWLLLG